MSPEKRGDEPGHEHESLPYYHAVRFQKEGAARQAYFAAQDTIYKVECNISTYRFLLRGIWHVAVIGEPPPEELDQELRHALRHGDPVPLPEDLLSDFTNRAKEARRLAPWVERHYRPGERF